MNKISLCFILFGLLSSSQAEEIYYVPIHNLVPLSYNPLTTNYNPDYDKYASVSSSMKSNSNGGPSVKLQSDDAKFAQLNKQYAEHVNAMVNADSLRDSVKNSALSSQDRFQMNIISGSSSGGCGSRGGPGYRKANGQCASWSD